MLGEQNKLPPVGFFEQENLKFRWLENRKNLSH